MLTAAPFGYPERQFVLRQGLTVADRPLGAIRTLPDENHLTNAIFIAIKPKTHCRSAWDGPMR
jgi:hypothetical protein